MKIKGLSDNTIKLISNAKNEEKRMLDFRLDSYNLFKTMDYPKFGPKIDIDFDKITYYKRATEASASNWEDVEADIKDTFDSLGVIEAEKNYLGASHAQVESESVYHNMLEDLTSKGIIFCDTDYALKNYSELFWKYFSKLVPASDNKFAALNSATWSGGTFIYVPKNTILERPLQSYFRINTKDMGQFERTLIIVDENSSIHYIEGCSAQSYTQDALHAAVVEIFVGENASCKYTTIQNWANNVYNLVTKRALVLENGKMEWIDGNIGAKVTMKYPACILKGDNSYGKCTTISIASKDQYQDTGAKMIHIGKNTKSNVVAKSIAIGNGVSNYRGLSRITKLSDESTASIKCDTIMIDKESKTGAIPTNIVENSKSSLEHEATVLKISEEMLFYLMSRGIDEDKAREMIVMGFTSSFKDELPMEYAVELNMLIKKYL